jgi:hypothetical protein
MRNRRRSRGDSLFPFLPPHLHGKSTANDERAGLVMCPSRFCVMETMQCDTLIVHIMLTPDMLVRVFMCMTNHPEAIPEWLPANWKAGLKPGGGVG